MYGLTQRSYFAGLCLLLFWQSGCAAFRPVQGVPARYLPTEMKLGERSGRRTIDLSLLRQPWSTHKIDAGDVLGVYIEGVVGKASDPPPVHFPQSGDFPPSFGLPFPVRDDGTISLPLVGAVYLRGLSVAQAEEKVTKAYLEPKQILNPNELRVQVNLQRPRQYRVLVIRQDSRSEPQPNAFLGQMNIGMVKRGTGKVVSLPAYSNDVLNALTATDGLPGLDAENAVYVIRRQGNLPGGHFDPNMMLNFDPATLMQQSAAGNGMLIRGQSPDGDDDSGYLHGQGLIGTGHGSRSQTNYQMAPGNAYGPYPQQNMQGAYSSLQPPGPVQPSSFIQPPRIWPDRMVETANGNSSYQEEYVTGASGAYPSFPQGTSAPMSPTPIDPRGNGYNNGPGPSGYGQAYPAQGYPTQNYSASNNVQQGYVPPGNPPDPYASQGSNGQGYGGLKYNSSNYTAPPPPSPNDGSYGPPPYANAQPYRQQYNGPQSPTPSPYGQQYPVSADPRPFPEPNPDFGPGHVTGTNSIDGRHVIRIPIRLGPGEVVDVRPEDVILHDGDIIFIESRDTEVFYTGGLLGGGQYMLPRDYDLDILRALSIAQSRTTGVVGNAIGGVSALNSDVAISPSTAIVLRKLPDGSELPIKVDLYRARTDLAERVYIQPGDFILLQYTPLEAIAAFFERHLLETALFGLTAQQLNRTGN